MLPRERIRMVLQHREPDRIPIHDSPWAATIDRWRTEGLPSGVSPEDYFGYEIAIYSADTSPRFPVEVLYRDEEYIVEKTPYGGVRKNHRDYSTTPMIIDYPCKTRDDWEKIKPRLKADDYRVDWVSGLQSFHREHSLGRFIMYGAGVGYDKVQNYVAS
ncbi:MAG: hypothetical protein QXR06_04755, partial [Candidatus Bathyarchaeia archaeon]